jgi:Zn-dependent protease with chaperone function
VAAFRAQKYAQALDLFKRLEQLPPSSPYHLKALMGQVRVHQRLNQVDQARISCQALTASASPQAQAWARQVLCQLPEVTEAKSSSKDEPASDSSGADLSGFVPLTNAAQSFQPPGASAPKAADSPSPTSRPTQGKATRSGQEVRKQDTAKMPEETYQSLFHFQQLNQPPGGGANDDYHPIAAPGESRPPDASPRPAAQLHPQIPLPQYPLGLWLGQGFTAIALLWLINWAFHFTLRTADISLRWIRWPVQLSLPGAYQTYTPWVVSGLVILALASPWIMDFALALWYGQKPLSTRQLQGHSPGALRLLRQVCRQRGWQLPELRVIPDPAPLCFSYGWLARNSRIVVSQGMLDQHSDEVLTALYGYELARVVNGSLPVLSSIGLLLLLLHTGYHRLAQVGNRLTQPLGHNILGIQASGLYGLFWLLRQLVLWLSRLCCSWGDRRAIALTQHPDHLAEGLLQFTEAIAADLQQRGTLHPLHTSLEVLMPVSGRQAITPGSLLANAGGRPKPDPAERIPQDTIAHRATTVATLVALDSLNPYRQWLRVSASHPSLGERLVELDRQASLRQQPTSVARSLESPPSSRLSPSLLLLQKGPLAGLLLGGGIAMGLWFVGGIVNRLGWQRLSWLYQDPSVLMGGLWLGLGLGLLLRINALFPDLGSPTATRPTSAAAPDTISGLLHRNSTLPVQGKPVTLQGRLSGRADLGNWGCQDLYLDDGSGLVKLTNPVPLGSLQGLLQHSRHPLHWIGQAATVTGWSRYGGGMLWVDIHQVQIDSRRSFSAYGPIWATLLSLSISLLGIFTIFRGG